MDALLGLQARFLVPLAEWIRATPVHVLLVLVISLVLFALVSVCRRRRCSLSTFGKTNPWLTSD
jgi:hypothetical protein